MTIKTIILLLIPFTFGMTVKLKSQTLNGHWTLICYTDLITGKQDCKSSDDQTQSISLEFKDDGKTGVLVGHTISNDVKGIYTLSNKNKIKVEQFGGTKVGESGWGSNFWKTIRESSSYKYSDDTLLILYANDSKIMKFVKENAKKSE